MDEETKKTLAEGEMVMNFVESDGWRYAKDRLMELVKENESIFSVDKEKPRDEIVLELGGRQLAVEMVKEWVEIIEGRANQHKSQVEEPENQEEEIVKEYAA